MGGFKQDCPNGRLTPPKFVDMYKLFFPSGNAEQFCDHVFRTFDTDKNGYIDFKEFLLAIDVTSAGTPEEKLKWAFRMYDVDGNGVIDLEEMTKIVQAIYDMLGAGAVKPTDTAEERAKNIFNRMDENKDGISTGEEKLIHVDKLWRCQPPIGTVLLEALVPLFNCILVVSGVRLQKLQVLLAQPRLALDTAHPGFSVKSTLIFCGCA